jgi:hypothetical protein
MRSDRGLGGLGIGLYGLAAIERPAVFGADRDPGAFVAEDRCLNVVFDGWAVAALQYRTQQTREARHHIGVLTAWLRPEMLHYPLAYQLADAGAEDPGDLGGLADALDLTRAERDELALAYAFERRSPTTA